MIDFMQGTNPGSIGYPSNGEATSTQHLCEMPVRS